MPMQKPGSVGISLSIKGNIKERPAQYERLPLYTGLGKYIVYR